MSPTTDPGADDLRLAIEAIVLGAEPEFDQPAFEAASGIPLERAQRYWRALGFPDAEPGETPYTATDVEALKHALDLVDNGGIEEKYVLAVTRALGQTMSRLADWEVDIAVDRLLVEGRPIDPVRTRARLESSLPDLEHMLVHAWRRHLLAAVERVLDADQDDLSAVSLTVGFADLVGFTGLTRRLDEDELGSLVEGFEAWAAGSVIALGGRLVKTMGDEVLFAALEPEVGIEAALLLAAGWGRDQPAGPGGPGHRPSRAPDGRRVRDAGQPGEPADGVRAPGERALGRDDRRGGGLDARCGCARPVAAVGARPRDRRAVAAHGDSAHRIPKTYQ